MSGCHGQPHSTAPPGELRVGQPTEIAPLNPVIAADGFSSQGHYLVYDTLIEHDSDLRPIPRLLERWQTLDGARRFRLILRHGLRFQDGAPVTAADVVFTLEQIRRPENESPYAGDFAAVELVRAIDEYTIDLVLSRPAHHLIDVLEFGVLPKHLLVDRPLRANPFNVRPVGAGPFQVRKLASNLLELESNHDYYGGAPVIQRIAILSYEADELWRRLLARHIEVALVVPWSKHRFLNRLRTIRLDQSSRTMGMSLRFNVRRAPFNEARMRRAFSAAVDRKLIVEKAERGFGIPSERLDPRETPAARFSPEETRRLLGGRRFTLGALRTFSDAIDIAMELQRQLAAVDVDVQIIPLTLAEMQDMSWAERIDMAFSPVWSPQPIEDVGYVYRDIPGVSSILDGISQTADETQRRAMFGELERRVLEDSSLTILFWQPVLSAYRAQYCGYHMTNLFTGLDRIRLCS